MRTETVQGRILGFLMETLEEMKKESEICEDVTISGSVPLVGDEAIVDSRSLVELLIALEEFIGDEYHADFDWSSDRAMSAKNSPFRTPQALAEFAISESQL